MFEFLMLILFGWLFFESLRLTFRVAWGVAKITAIILFVVALPALVGCLLMASGILLLLPIALLGIAFGILKVSL